jgi:hypothetical protein
MKSFTRRAGQLSLELLASISIIRRYSWLVLTPTWQWHGNVATSSFNSSQKHPDSPLFAQLRLTFLRTSVKDLICLDTVILRIRDPQVNFSF